MAGDFLNTFLKDCRLGNLAFTLPQALLVLKNPYGASGESLSVRFKQDVGEDYTLNSVDIGQLPTVQALIKAPSTQSLDGGLVAAFAFALQSSVIPSLYAQEIMVDLAAFGYRLEDEDVQEAISKQVVFFYYVQWFERNNIRYCLGMGADGFHLPHIAHRTFYSNKIGDYGSDAGMQSSLLEALAAFDVREDVREYLLGYHNKLPADLGSLAPQVTDPSRTSLNMSFGKESLFVYEFLNRESSLFTFSHNTDPTDYEQRAKKLDPNARHMICDYLPHVLDPVGGQLLPGAPIHTLFIPHMMAQCSSLSSREFSHILFGDEYERAASLTYVKFQQGFEMEPVFTYDFNQTPRFMLMFNFCKHDEWPAIGSVMYNLTGLQAQMLFDAMDSNILQTSCHPSLVTGKNCGKCAKCHRVGVRKKVVGTMENVDYDISWAAAGETCNWTLLEYYGHGENYGDHHNLWIQHKGMQAISSYFAGTIEAIPKELFDEFWKSMGTLSTRYLSLMDESHLRATLQQVAERQKEVVQAKVKLR